ncbi:amino acid transporter [Alicyclobacillus hesperidum URH17-3-68]|nr:hypothetical protein [Alicyclobacillus hesperidum]EJY54455.1 amino acid transporter [Alicyclobacillus hesperidum URH17-3-68]
MKSWHIFGSTSVRYVTISRSEMHEMQPFSERLKNERTYMGKP